MLFNSVTFAVFFAIFYPLYRLASHRGQNRLLLAASYIFYGWWDWRFLGLLLLSTTADYYFGRRIGTSQNAAERRTLLTLSLLLSLTILGFFKYFNFFAHSFIALAGSFGWQLHVTTLNIILPIGVSFYTFQTMSYTIDVYRRKLQPAQRFFDFAVFVSFFPQLVAGPIERATHLLPQVLQPRQVTAQSVREGCYLILWGLYQKVVIADNLAGIVDPIFNAPPPYRAMDVLLAVYAFAFQIFCDFAGYSNIARGLAKLMGFELMINFKQPYFAANPGEFWQHWHISLSTWLRDYLYIPLGGNRKGQFKTLRNLFITMFLGGLWHGAAWTFILWGIYHGVLLIVYRLAGAAVHTPEQQEVPSSQPGKIIRFLNILLFFHLVCLGWLFFRASSAGQAFAMLQSFWLRFDPAQTYFLGLFHFLFLIAPLLAAQIFEARWKDSLFIFRYPAPLRGLVYFILLQLIIIFGVRDSVTFIYFQF